MELVSGKVHFSEIQMRCYEALHTSLVQILIYGRYKFIVAKGIIPQICTVRNDFPCISLNVPLIVIYLK